MKNISLVNIFILILIFACNENNVKDWDENQIDEWYEKSAWNTILTMKPDASINRRLFVEQNILNPQSWMVALKFLKESDFDKIPEGKYDLSDNGTFITITDYLTKDSACFEAHRKYIDIQYVAKGQEYILMTPLEDKIEVTPYNEEMDIEFFNKYSYTRHLASQDNFFAIFPGEGHKPCMKVKENDLVRKIVLKIPFKK